MSDRTLDALDRFLQRNVPILKYSFKPPNQFNASDSVKYDGNDAPRVKQDCETLARILEIPWQEALEIVLQYSDHRDSKPVDRLTDYVRHYCAEKRYKIKLTSELLRTRTNSAANLQRQDSLVAIAKKHSTELLIDSVLFVDVINTAKRIFSSQTPQSEHDSINVLLKTEVSTSMFMCS